MQLSASIYLPIVCLVCLGAATTHAQEQSVAIAEITVCTPEATWVESGYRDIFETVFGPVGVQMQVRFMPYKISIMRAREKACDLAMGGYMNQYTDLLYPLWPTEVEEVTVAYAAGAKFQNHRSFIGKKIAWMQNYAFELHLSADIDYTEVRSEVLGLRMLKRGSIDYFIDYKRSINSAAALSGIDLSAYKLSPVPKLSLPSYPMFRHDDRGATLIALYDRRMAEIHKDGTLRQLIEKYELGYPVPAGN